jgi:hypothetical protein
MGKDKCARYWPERPRESASDVVEYGPGGNIISVATLSVEKFDAYTLSKIEVGKKHAEGKARFGGPGTARDSSCQGAAPITSSFLLARLPGKASAASFTTTGTGRGQTMAHRSWQTVPWTPSR